MLRDPLTPNSLSLYMTWKTGQGIRRNRMTGLNFLKPQPWVGRNITLFSVMKLNALNVRTCNCNHFCKTSALSHLSLFSSQSSVNPGFSLLSFSPGVGSLQGILQSLSLLRCILIWLLATQGYPWPPLAWLLSASTVPLLLLPDTSRVHQHSAAPEPSGNVHGASKFSLLEISRPPQPCELVFLH